MKYFNNESYEVAKYDSFLKSKLCSRLLVDTCNWGSELDFIGQIFIFTSQKAHVMCMLKLMQFPIKYEFSIKFVRGQISNQSNYTLYYKHF